MDNYSAEEALQKAHFDDIGAEYAAHYGDAWSQRYRDEFIDDPMLAGLELAGCKALDAMCGSGESTGCLLKRGADVTAVDISEQVIEQFRERFPSCTAGCASILDTGFPDGQFDCAVVVGGLHHLHPDVSRAVREIHRVLKPGGHFCFVEAHKGAMPDLARRLWYRLDRRMFADNEAAIDVPALKAEFADAFDFIGESYKGSMAYLLVFNSLIFRIPLGLKRYYAPLLLALEPGLDKIQGRLLSCFVVCQWRKR